MPRHLKPKRGSGTRPALKKKKLVSDEIPSDSDGVLSQSDSQEDEYEHETAHEKHIRLTRKAIQKAKEQIGSDEEELQNFSLRLKEEALLEKGRLTINLASKVILDFQFRLVDTKGLCHVSVYLKMESMLSVVGKTLPSLSKVAVFRGGKRGSSYPYHTGPILSISISSDSKYLASSSMDETVVIWNPDTMSVCMKLRQHRAAVTAVAFRRHSHMLFTADCSGRVCVWNMPLTEVLQDQGARTNIEILGLCGLTAERCVSCSGFGGPGICVWKVPEEVCVQYSTKNAFETAVECVYAVNDDVFIGGSATNKLYVWHVSRGSPVFTVNSAHPEPKLVGESFDSVTFHRPVANWVSAVAGLPGTDLIASASSTGHVQFWRLIRASDELDVGSNRSSQQQRAQIKLERLVGCSVSLTGFVNSMTFSPDQQFLVVSLGQEHRLGKWELRRPVDAAVCLIPLNLPVNHRQRNF
ncbi:hypothetical protein EG68_04769 [Paragonimus skrjabini miyazakii]|uniref:Ribosomal RNA-processing protein 9 n=1 Tax=Paragonimus skrjabini miyazakii TaxID=59628 RepID=A0A8S9YXD1_9TREM|nr:hypothetical protein EG68_04769 [Paragonimus skrjabini miyazakii]